jgi:hypothetical protein
MLIKVYNVFCLNFYDLSLFLIETKKKMKRITQIKDSSHDWILLLGKTRFCVHPIEDEIMFALVVSCRDRKLHAPIEGMN